MVQCTNYTGTFLDLMLNLNLIKEKHKHIIWLEIILLQRNMNRSWWRES